MSLENSLSKPGLDSFCLVMYSKLSTIPTFQENKLSCQTCIFSLPTQNDQASKINARSPHISNPAEMINPAACFWLLLFSLITLQLSTVGKWNNQ
jgi:hypothetical protein